MVKEITTVRTTAKIDSLDHLVQNLHIINAISLHEAEVVTTTIQEVRTTHPSEEKFLTSNVPRSTIAFQAQEAEMKMQEAEMKIQEAEMISEKSMRALRRKDNTEHLKNFNNLNRVNHPTIGLTRRGILILSSRKISITHLGIVVDHRDQDNLEVVAETET